MLQNIYSKELKQIKTTLLKPLKNRIIFLFCSKERQNPKE